MDGCPMILGPPWLQTLHYAPFPHLACCSSGNERQTCNGAQKGGGLSMLACRAGGSRRIRKALLGSVHRHRGRRPAGAPPPSAQPPCWFPSKAARPPVCPACTPCQGPCAAQHQAWRAPPTFCKAQLMTADAARTPTCLPITSQSCKTRISCAHAQKQAAVAAKAAAGEGFVLQAMHAASVGYGDAVPLALVFRCCVSSEPSTTVGPVWVDTANCSRRMCVLSNALAQKPFQSVYKSAPCLG